MKMTWLWAIASFGMTFLVFAIELWAESMILFHFGQRPIR